MANNHQTELVRTRTRARDLNISLDEIDEFRLKWEQIGKLNTLVEALDKSEDYEDAFQGHFGDFLEFLQTEHRGISTELLGEIPEDVRGKLDFGKEYFEKYRMNCLTYGLEHLDDIVEQAQDRRYLDKITIGANILPIKETDMDRADDLDALMDDYEDKIQTLKANLRTINPETERERYDTQARTIREYQEFVGLNEDFRELIEHILVNRELQSYLGGEKEQPNLNKMRELFFGHLDNILERVKGDEEVYEDNLPLIKTIKALAGNKDFLTNNYYRRIMMPAQEKLGAVLQKYDLEDYVKRNVRVMSTTKQMQVFNTVYALAKQSSEQERSENLRDKMNRLYDGPLREAA